MTIRRNVVRVKWRNVNETNRALRAVPATVRAGVLLALPVLALLMQNFARKGIQSGPKTGRKYRRRSITHVASAPGEFPATDTGTLVRSVIGETEKETLEAICSTGTLYAKWLEFGTRKMAARPFLRPTLEVVSEKAGKIIRDSVRRAVQNG